MDSRLATIILASVLAIASGKQPTPELPAKDVSAIRAVDAAYVTAVPGSRLGQARYTIDAGCGVDATE